jgi:NAD(P)-dependent dehydrogenase (short-subunit alcohol dehydrogenase family)
MKLFDMSGTVALITGSTKGIGKATAFAMAEAGAKIVVTSRKADACEETAQEIIKAGGEAIAVPANISHDNEIEALVSKTMSHWGRVDSLVCNAAVNPYYGPFLDTPDDAFEKTVRVNIRSNMTLSKLCIPSMIDNGGGSIVIISSIAAFKGSDMLGIYAVTKAADCQVVRNLASAYGPKNIRANAISPALVKTDFAKALWEDPARAEVVAQSYALKRLGEPDDIAGAVVYLTAPSGKWMTGQTLIIDGGWSILGA